MNHSSVSITLKELTYLLGAIASIGGLYVAVIASDARQTAQIENLQRSRDENHAAILEQARQVAELAGEMKALRTSLDTHIRREDKR